MPAKRARQRRKSWHVLVLQCKAVDQGERMGAQARKYRGDGSTIFRHGTRQRRLGRC